MPTRVRDRQVGQVLVDIEKRRARDKSREIELAPSVGVTEIPAAVDELETEARRADQTD
jgi:hypothetical protein